MPSNFSSMMNSGGGAALLIAELGELQLLKYRTLSNHRAGVVLKDVPFHGIVSAADTTLEEIEEHRDLQTILNVTAIRQTHGTYIGLPAANAKDVVVIDGVAWAIQSIDDESDVFWQLRVFRKAAEKRDKLSEP